MVNKEAVITGLSATVRTESGRKILRRGEALPEDALAGEAERLTDLGVYGEPKDHNADTRDEAQVLTDEMTRVEGDESVVNVEPEVDTVGNVAYMKTANIDEVMKRVGDDPALASELIAAENEARGEDARPSLLEKLTAVADGSGEQGESEPAGDANGEGSGDGSAEPTDYSELKQPQLKALLDERDIEYPKGVVANEKLVALLKESDKAA
jgi:hypothetical protein